MRIYQVGGSVRDKLLNRPCQDKDYVVVGTTEAEMLAQGFKKVGKSFPVFLHPETKEEYALARKEIKIGKRHQDFRFEFTPNITLEEDALRRDFTCNALYLDEEKNKIIDYHNGIADINNHILRHVSEHFIEDPLRILRMCRFAAQLDFSIAPETMVLCKKMVQRGDLKYLSSERIWNELEKALHCKSFDKFILTARECGALKEILPEVEQLWKIPERTDYHPEGNSGDHTLLAIQYIATDDSYINFATLLHDIGKTATNSALWPSHKGHDIIGEKIITSISQRMSIPTSYIKFAKFCALNHMLSHQKQETIEKKLIDIAIKIHSYKQENYLERFISVMRADIHGRARVISKEEEKNFGAIINKLRKICKKVSEIKLNLYPEFKEILQKYKKNIINSQEFDNEKRRIIISKIER